MKDKINSTFIIEISDKNLSKVKTESLPIVDMEFIEGTYKELYNEK